MLNLEYPDAIHVEGSVWEVQKTGRLALPDMNREMATGHERKRLDEIAFQRTVEALETFGELVNRTPSAAEPTNFVLLLVDEMMWNRFVFRHGHVALKADISEPEEDVDLVVVTETSVIMAIIDASMSIAEAEEMRVLRIYGELEKEALFLSRFRHPVKKMNNK